MKNSRLLTRAKSSLKLALLLFSVGFFGCEDAKIETTAMETANAQMHSQNLVKVTSTGMEFDAPDEIPSGWTTFKYMNKSNMVHFFLLQKLPEGKSLEDSRAEVLPVFQAGMDFWREGDDTNAFGPDGFGGLPDWYSQIIMNGGPGLISGGETALTSVYMEPGTYVMECYVKSSTGQFHSYMGMVDQIIVTEDSGSDREPKADIAVTIGSETGPAPGITMEKAPQRPGRHSFSVEYVDQAVYQNLLQHDVHLVKVDESVTQEDLDKLNKWMNWFYVGEDMEGLIDPAPTGFTFLGGIQELPVGEKGYFSAVLSPGSYLLISEIDNPIDRNMYAKFDIH